MPRERRIALMARVLVFQHVAAEPLGVLDPMLRARGHRIRYANFARDPGAVPRLDRYQGLIVLGGPMQVTETREHPHLVTECRLIEQALEREIPVLGICLGAQLMAHVLGGEVGPCRTPEIGWYEVSPTPATSTDPVLAPLDPTRPIFQWHHWGVECPPDSVALANSPASGCQAFRHGRSAWGFQFHLELDQRLIHRWLNLPAYRRDLEASGLDTTPDKIREDTAAHLPEALTLADRVFGAWLDLLGVPEQRIVLPSR